MSIELIGWVALVLTQVFWIPNIGRILRTRDVQGYSLVAWVMMLGGLSCWLIYFVSKGDLVGVVANVCGVLGAAITLACIWRWRKRSIVVAQPVGAPLFDSIGEPLTTDQG